MSINLMNKDTKKAISMATEENKFMWYDREIRFDVKMYDLAMIKGEKIVDSMNDVEDTKGNNGDRGCMIITNLRCIWFCGKDKHINLTIGHDCILDLNVKDV